MRYVFGEYLLDVNRRELRRSGEPLALEPQVFDLLVYLVQHSERVVGKDDLVQAIWGGRIVSDSALTTRINAVRRVLGDSGEKQRFVRTFPRKGVRFIADIEQVSEGAPSRAVSAATARGGPRPAAFSGPSLAVLAFSSIGGDPDGQRIADGIGEHLATVLSRFHWLSVIARCSSVAYEAQTADVRRVGLELGVRYLLDGSVHRNGDRVRITIQLIEAESRAHLWADWCDGTLAEVFELQDRLSAKVMAAVEPVLEWAEIARSMLRSANELSAHDLYLHALPGCYGYGAQPLLRARDLLQQAIEREPGFAPALAAAAGCRQFLAATGWVEDPQLNRMEAIELAHQALQADGDDPAVLAEAARVLGYFTEDIDSAMAMAERALALNPNRARGWYWSGWIRLFAGQPDRAIEDFQNASRRDPRHRPYLTGIGAAHFFSGRFAEASNALVTASHQLPGWPTTYRFLAAACTHLGKLGKAQDVTQRLRALTPAFCPVPDGADSPFRNRNQSALYLDGLRAAAEAA